ncbi:MAG: alpha/beta hydrolase [Burkholderiaceae bacterium]|nr:alpha/beta hydrolase [Burkholderiaceae bacterium]
MPKQPSHASDLRGLSKMTIDAIVGVADLAEAVHMNILDQVAKFGVPAREPLSGAAALIYRSVRGIARWVGGGIDFALERLTPVLGKGSTWPGRESLLAALNGVLGDYLAARSNPLAITMAFRRAGKPLKLEKPALTAAFPAANGRILVLAHGLCMNDLEWSRNGHDHGAALARDRGYTPLYLHYNSGLHISTNGRLFAQQLETLLQEWPVAVEELAILGHSMGGLVARSAYHYGTAGKMRWTKYLRKLVFVGTPHHGAPLERGGNWFHLLTDVSPYTAPFSNLGKIRSAGITDLRYGNLLDTDWESVDRFAHVGDLRTPVPLPAKVPCFALAATTGKQAGDISDRLLGDGLVPLQSALGRHANPSLNLELAPEHQWIGYGINHLDLLSRPEVYQQLLKWL